MKSRLVADWVSEFLRRRPVRANSLIITVYGDFIAPHGGTLWLGSLARLVEPLGLNERMVRTSVYRLSREQWLASERIGRRSYYSLTASGRRRFEHAYRRIYFAPGNDWDGTWQLVAIPSALGNPAREGLRRELLWAGWGAVAPGVFAHPSSDTAILQDILKETGTLQGVVAMRAASIGEISSRPLRELVHDCWNLERLSARYREFIEFFRPVVRAVRAAQDPDPEQCFLVQTLLMHDFRRVLLHDPQLPPQLLVQGWSGGIARELCAELYRLTFRFAQKHLLAAGEARDGPLRAAAPYFYERFGGLTEAPDSIVATAGA
ncbi:MAG: phenylacetic acid degradation operon negative regulatory protein PaaX [Burkholderiales bacterium]|nr:phenylacetic acid degradation operon negative regulatory protein PaaX [Burkholderiales bacterium]